MTGGIPPHGPVFRFHFFPISGLHQMPRLRPLHLESFPSTFVKNTEGPCRLSSNFKNLPPIAFGTLFPL
ncbi:MAG: hypothetical protein AMJ94_19240 [Deltaproteobacteria bacterium SM23_61]|nr:MAG: hypothetical protein AMJ94_19240 [Deltaproteobacteria bacterium SM23_61]